MRDKATQPQPDHRGMYLLPRPLSFTYQMPHHRRRSMVDTITKTNVPYPYTSKVLPPRRQPTKSEGHVRWSDSYVHKLIASEMSRRGGCETPRSIRSKWFTQQAFRRERTRWIQQETLLRESPLKL